MRASNEEAIAKLISYGADINQRDNEGMTALMNRVRERYVYTACCLIMHGADVNIKNNDLGEKLCQYLMKKAT